jgi:hypothetical protein
MRQTFFGSPKSIAGVALVGLGITVLYQNLDGATTQLSQLICTTRGEALGVLPSVVLVSARVMQAYAFDHRRFLEGFFQQLWVLFWPLLLVVVGTVLSRDGFKDQLEALARPNQYFQKKDTGGVDLAAPRSTCK